MGFPFPGRDLPDWGVVDSRRALWVPPPLFTRLLADTFSTLDAPSLLLPLFAPVLSGVAGAVAWVGLAFLNPVVVILRQRWLAWALVVVLPALLAAAWVLIRTAPRSSAMDGEQCIRFESTHWVLAGWMLLAALATGGVAALTAWAVEGQSATRWRSALAVVGVAVPYGIAYLIVQDGFCGWN